MKKNKRLIKIPGLMILLAVMWLSLKTTAQTVFVVTTVEDFTIAASGVPGELRWAIEQANLTNGPSLITFKIPGTPPFVINLTAILPTINKTVEIDGTSQAGYDSNDPASPVIIINGGGAITTGLSFLYSVRSKVSGIYIRNFQYGLELNHCDYCWITNNVINQVSGTDIILTRSTFCTIKGNYLNTNKTLSHLSINAIDGISMFANGDNTIGGTNCGDENTIGFAINTGINNSSQPGVRNRLSGNRIFGSGVAEINSGGLGNATPVITETGCVTKGTSTPSNTIELFGSSGTSGARNAMVYMGTTKADALGKWSISISNIVYPYVTATSSSDLKNTSDLATVYPIDVDTMQLTIVTPSRTCVGEKLTFEKSGSTCWGGLELVWDFGDGSPPSSSPSHIYKRVGIYFIKVTAYRKNNCEPKTATIGAYVRRCNEFDCANLPCAIDFIPNGPLNGGMGPEGPIWYFYVTPVGGTPPYTYLWSNPSNNLRPITGITTNTLQTADAGSDNYSISVTITDKNGCTVTKDLPLPGQFSSRKKN